MLSVLLDRHSRIAVTPETAFFDDIAPIAACANESVIVQALGAWSRLGELGLDVETVRAHVRKWSAGNLLAAMLELYAANHGKARAGEKTPQHLFRAAMIRRMFPAAKIVCVLRDGRDVALSLNRMPWWKHGLRGAARTWQRSVRAMQKHPELIVVRHEELLRDPRGALTTLMHTLGETFEPQQLDVAIPSDAVLPRSREWKGQALHAPDAALADARRAEASAEELAYLTRTLARELHACGYH